MNFENYLPQFKSAVLAHLASRPEAEFEAQRYLALDESRWPVGWEGKVLAIATPAELVEAGVTEDGISIDALLAAPRARGEAIGEIAGQPIYFLSGLGTYAWSPAPAEPFSLVLWVSFPAYPLGW
jgi:hypothetical protein